MILPGVVAAARLAIGRFPAETVETGRATTRGVVHLLPALVAFTAAPWAAVALPRSDHGQPALGWAMAPLALVTMASLRSGLRPWFGLIERGYYVAMLAWLALVSARLV